MDIRYARQREAGPYAIESYQELGYDDCRMPSSFLTRNCYVVYGDRGCPSHCVRIFRYED